MNRDKIGGVPFDVKEEANRTVLRFYPKNPNAKNPNSVVFVLFLDSKDKEQLVKILE